MSIAYSVRRHPRSRCVRIIIRSDATVVVTAPRRVSLRFIDRFVRDRADWIRSMVARLPTITNTTPATKVNKAARELIARLVDKYCAAYGVQCGRISVRSQRSRWGSCSSQGNLSFNYRLVEMPSALAEYVVVHEVCHLLEMNHSPRFWALVARTIPDHRVRRKALRAWGLTNE